MAHDGLENLAGYICHRLRSVEEIHTDSNNDNTFTWVNHLSEGGLSKPTSDLMLRMEELDKVFNEFNGTTVTITQNFIGQLLEFAEAIKCDLKVKKLFFRSRMYFRIRKLNEGIIVNSKSNKRKQIRTIT